MKSSTDIQMDKIRVVNSTKTTGWIKARLIPINIQMVGPTDLTIKDKL